MNTAVAKTFRYPKVITHVKCSASLNHADNINKHFPLLAEVVDMKTVISQKCKQTVNTLSDVLVKHQHGF